MSQVTTGRFQFGLKNLSQGAQGRLWFGLERRAVDWRLRGGL